jgi:hypothetical protein
VTAVRKTRRDGKVAVLVSPGYGAGWSTWVNSPQALFDPDLVEALERGASVSELERIAEANYPDGYMGGVANLVVKWVPEGTRFEIQECDGAETLRILGPDVGVIA